MRDTITIEIITVALISVKGSGNRSPRDVMLVPRIQELPSPPARDVTIPLPPSRVHPTMGIQKRGKQEGDGGELER